MVGADRVAIVGLAWFVAVMVASDLVGQLFGMPGTGLVIGFFVALLSVLTWPWLLPRRVEEWMDDPTA